MKKEQEKKEQEAQESTLEERLTTRFGGELELWRKRYAPRKLTILEVEDKALVLRPITADVMGRYSMMMATDGLAEATRYALNELTLGGDVAILDDEEYFMSAMMQFSGIVELKKSVVSRL